VEGNGFVQSMCIGTGSWMVHSFDEWQRKRRSEWFCLRKSGTVLVVVVVAGGVLYCCGAPEGEGGGRRLS